MGRSGRSIFSRVGPPVAKAGPDRYLGWIGTGDASFVDDQDFDAFKHHFFKELQLTKTFLLPHHGSKHSWDIANIKKLYQSSCFRIENFIAAAEPLKGHRHPHASVTAACSVLAHFFVVTEDDCTQFAELVVA
jgi:hypothetical protein